MSAEALLRWLTLSSLTTTLLIGLVLLLRRPVGALFGARAAQALWAMPALRLALPPLGFGLLVLSRDEPALAPPLDAASPQPLLGITDATVLAPAGIVATAAETGAGLPSMSVLLLAVWLGGAVVALAAGVLSTASWRRTLLRERTTEASPPLRAALDRAAREAGYRGPVELAVTAAAESPQVIGVRRPLVAVPASFADRFTPDQQRLALLHECTHLARRDLWALAFAEAACAVHWFNPLLRRSLRAFRADQEAACDEAVRSRGAPTADYADTLLRAASGPLVPALTLNHDLKRRIETMARPLPRTTARLLGTTGVLALALGAAAATQQASGDPDAPSERRDETRSISTYAWSSDDDRGEIRVERGGEIDMVLLSDPFAALTGAQPEPPRATPGAPPAPPAPPAPAVRKVKRIVVVTADGETDRTIELPDGAALRLEDGTPVIVPPAVDGEWEIEMEAFSDLMEDFSDEMEDWSEEFENGFAAEMEVFGERMGAWGEQMGAVGEAVGQLGDRCEAHRERTAKPTVLEATVAGSGTVVKAVCARGGAERYASVEMARFVERQRGLTAEEKAAFAENRRGGGLLVTRR